MFSHLGVLTLLTKKVASMISLLEEQWGYYELCLLVFFSNLQWNHSVSLSRSTLILHNISHKGCIHLYWNFQVLVLSLSLSFVYKITSNTHFHKIYFLILQFGNLQFYFHNFWYILFSHFCVTCSFLWFKLINVFFYIF